mgnify:CR=1 FL=1
MKILIIGVSGFIGRSIYENLSTNHEVYGISRSDLDLKNCFKVDLYNLKELDFFFKKNDFDVIINLASRMANKNNLNNFSLLEDNLLMSKNLINVLNNKEYGHLINFSSSAVYPNISGIFSEDDSIDTSINSDCLYGLSKFNNEMLFSYFLKKINILNLRIGYVYGDGMDESRIHKVFENELKEKNKITIWGNGERSFPQISIEYLNSILLNIIENRITGTCNLAEENISLIDLAKNYIQLYGDTNSEIIFNTKYNNNNVFEMRFDKIINLLKK